MIITASAKLFFKLHTKTKKKKRRKIKRFCTDLGLLPESSFPLGPYEPEKVKPN